MLTNDFHQVVKIRILRDVSSFTPTACNSQYSCPIETV